MKPSLWGKDGVKARCTKQGETLGDNWFLGAVSALAEQPDRVKKVFENKDYPKNGVFKTNFFIKGLKVAVSVDDRLPVSETG